MGQRGQEMISNSWNNDHQIDGLIRFYNQIRNGTLRDGSSADR